MVARGGVTYGRTVTRAGRPPMVARGSSPGRTSVIHRDRIPPVRDTKPNQDVKPSTEGAVRRFAIRSRTRPRNHHPGSHPAGSRYEAESGRETVSQKRSRRVDVPSRTGRTTPKLFGRPSQKLRPSLKSFGRPSPKTFGPSPKTFWSSIQKSLGTVHPKKIFLFIEPSDPPQGRVRKSSSGGRPRRSPAEESPAEESGTVGRRRAPAVLR